MALDGQDLAVNPAGLGLLPGFERLELRDQQIELLEPRAGLVKLGEEPWSGELEAVDQGSERARDPGSRS